MATQTCQLCGRKQEVLPDGRGFPPDVAKRKLQKWCNLNGCPSQPKYTPTILVGSRPRGM